MLIKNKTGEVRLIFRFLILIGLVSIIAFLLRFIPIIIKAQLLVNDGMLKDDAIQEAKSIIFDIPIWNAILSTIQGLFWLIIVIFLIRKIERRSFSWKAIGMDWRKSTPLILILGLLIGCILHISYLFIGNALDTSSLHQNIIIKQNILTILLNVVLYIFLGFGEEIGFRAYFQTRVIKLYGTLLGILFTAVLFTLSHMIFRPLTILELFSGVCLYMAIGILYFMSQSVYFVGIIHALLNLLPQVFKVTGEDLEVHVVNVVFFILVISVFLGFRKRISHLIISNRE